MFQCPGGNPVLLLHDPRKERDPPARPESVEDSDLIPADFEQSAPDGLRMGWPKGAPPLLEELDERQGVGQIPALKAIDQVPNGTGAAGSYVLVNMPASLIHANRL